MTDSGPDASEAALLETPSDTVAVPWWKSANALAFVNLGLVLVAITFAVASWLEARHPAPHYSDDQVARAKTSVCSAYAIVRVGIVENTHLTIPNSSDQTAELAVFANARLALLGGGGFLRDRLSAEFATPAEIAAAATTFALTAEQLGANYAAGADNSAQESLRRDLDSQIDQLNKLCGNP